MQHVGSGCDRIRTQIEAEASLLSSGDEAVSGSLVTSDVHVLTGHSALTLDAVGVSYAAVGVMTIVVTGTDHLNVCLGNSRFLGEFLADEVFGNREVAVEQPANQSYCKHVAALQHRLVVHAGVSQTILHHL